MLSRVFLATGFLLGAVNAFATISAVGSKFFDSNGNQFFVKGIAYQLTGDDPLVDAQQCMLDATLMKTLGANAIRVYHVDSSADHDECMSIFASNGIGLFLDLDTFNSGLAPTGTTWTSEQFGNFSAVMDAFHQYDNLIGFFVGNEVIDQSGQSLAAPYIKAAARDMKAYRQSKGYRSIPIGYSAADIGSLRPMLQDYLVCGNEEADAIEFFGLNAYEWCGPNTYDGSGYSNLNAMAQGYPIPIFFSETGCMTVKPRTFGDQEAILGPDMDETWSGAIIYEWIEEVNDYGLISYGPPAPGVYASNVADGYTRSGTPTPVLPDFTNLQSVWATLNPTGTPLSLYSVSNVTTPACPSATVSGWLVAGDVPLPTIGASLSAPATAMAMSSGTTSSSRVMTSAPIPITTTQTAVTSASSSASTNAASGGNEVVGMSVGLCAVLMGFVWWL